MASRERAIVNNLNERARFYGRPASEMLTIDDVRAVMAFYNYSSCLSGTKPATSVDHVKPLALGGTNTRDNLQLLTIEENKSKGNEQIDYRKGAICPDDFTPEQTEAEQSKYQDKAIDWKRIKTRYISEEIALRELARAEGISEASILKRSAKERWNEQREQYRIKVTSDVIRELAAKEVDSRLIAADTARAVIDSWLASVKEEASANDALNAAKLLLLLDGRPTERVANVTEDLEDDDIIRAAEQVARRSFRQSEERNYSRSAPDEDGLGAGWSD